jgi:hypothetical protein
MKGYRKSTGVYIELGDDIPVSNTLVPVALRPSANHIFSDTWDTDPLNPAVCWRLKTAPELTAEKNTELQDFLDSPGGKVVKAMALLADEKGIWTMAELRTKYRSL